MKLIKINYW